MRGVAVVALVSFSLVVACSDGAAERVSSGGHGSNDVDAGGGGSTSQGGAGGAHSSSSSSGSVGGGALGGAGGQGTGGGGGAGGAVPLTVADCFADAFVTPMTDGPDYDQFQPVVGSHCLGTNHQDIVGVERVVFLGDSVTVGTPPTWSQDFYRAELADALAAKYGLQPANLLWKSVDPFSGKALVKESGDFASCAKWGARTDDLLPTQLPDCFGAADLDKRTLVVMTMGGNDISSLTQDAIDGETEQVLWQKTSDFVELQRQAVQWLVEPGRFPNGVFVVFANMYEFTDGTGEVQACDVSMLAGFADPVPSPELLADMVIWANEQFVDIAVDTGTDVVFLLEEFCGHGFNAADPTAPCYRGPGNANWFDLTCIHPNPTGHGHIRDMFMAVVDE